MIVKELSSRGCTKATSMTSTAGTPASSPGKACIATQANTLEFSKTVCSERTKGMQLRLRRMRKEDPIGRLRRLLRLHRHEVFLPLDPCSTSHLYPLSHH